MALKTLRTFGVPAELYRLPFSWLRAMLERNDSAWDKGGSHHSHYVCESTVENKCTIDIHTAEITFVLDTVRLLSYIATHTPKTEGLMHFISCTTQDTHTPPKHSRLG